MVYCVGVFLNIVFTIVCREGLKQLKELKELKVKELKVK